MPSLFSASANAALMRMTGGVAVVKGSESTYGTPKGAPVVLLSGQGGSGGVLSADDAVVIANGTLTGVTARDGVGDTITVAGVSYTVIGITTPHDAGFPGGEFDGDMLALLLRA